MSKGLASETPLEPTVARELEDLDAALAAFKERTAAMPRASSHPDGRRIVVVLGMHRSGTSLLGQMLHYLGIDMADESDHASPKNPGGFWERPQLTKIQDEILAAIGRPVDSPLHSLPFPAGWWRSKEVQTLKKPLRDYISAQLAQCPGLWGFKDPRTCRLLPLWREIFDELALKPSYVWAVRTPGESSASMAAKSPALRPMTPSQAEVTWLAYNHDVIRYTSGSNPVIVDYSEWFGNPAATAKRLVSQLGLSPLLDESELERTARAIVNEDYRHEEKGKGRAISNIALAEQLFEEIVRPAAESDERLTRFTSVLDVVFRALAPFVELLADLPALRSQLRDAKKASTDISVGHEDLRRLSDEQSRRLEQSKAQIERLAPAAAEQEKTAAELLGLSGRLAKLAKTLDLPSPENVSKIAAIATRLEQLGQRRTEGTRVPTSHA